MRSVTFGILSVLVLVDVPAMAYVQDPLIAHEKRQDEIAKYGEDYAICHSAAQQSGVDNRLCSRQAQIEYNSIRGQLAQVPGILLSDHPNFDCDNNGDSTFTLGDALRTPLSIQNSRKLMYAAVRDAAKNISYCYGYLPAISMTTNLVNGRNFEIVLPVSIDVPAQVLESFVP